jgi:hypothetical protein
MPNTTNYSFPTPADTDLVKNGADAIRDLGDAVDTAMNTALGTKKAGMVLLNTTSFSAVASQSLNNIFSANYTNYKILINTSYNVLNMRLRVGGVDNTTASSYATTFVSVGSTALSNNRVTDTSFEIMDNTGLGSVALEVFAPFTTEKTRIVSNAVNDSGTSRLYLGYGFHNQTVSYDGITIFPDSSTLTGSIEVYGYNV